MLPTPPAAPVTTTSPRPGVDALLLQRHDGEHGGEAGGADRHRLVQAPCPSGRGSSQSALTRASCGQAAPVALAHAPAGEQDLVAGLRSAGRRELAHGAGEVDAGHERELAHDLAGAGDRQRVLVVQGRVGDVDQHLARRQGGDRQVLEAPARSCRSSWSSTSARNRSSIAVSPAAADGATVVPAVPGIKAAEVIRPRQPSMAPASCSTGRQKAPRAAPAARSGPCRTSCGSRGSSSPDRRRAGRARGRARCARG